MPPESSPPWRTVERAVTRLYRHGCGDLEVQWWRHLDDEQFQRLSLALYEVFRALHSDHMLTADIRRSHGHAQVMVTRLEKNLLIASEIVTEEQG